MALLKADLSATGVNAWDNALSSKMGNCGTLAVAAAAAASQRRADSISGNSLSLSQQADALDALARLLRGFAADWAAYLALRDGP